MLSKVQEAIRMILLWLIVFNLTMRKLEKFIPYNNFAINSLINYGFHSMTAETGSNCASTHAYRHLWLPKISQNIISWQDLCGLNFMADLCVFIFQASYIRQTLLTFNRVHFDRCINVCQCVVYMWVHVCIMCQFSDAVALHLHQFLSKRMWQNIVQRLSMNKIKLRSFMISEVRLNRNQERRMLIKLGVSTVSTVYSVQALKSCVPF